jgi:ADP-heptose:LPS heptosyltransferase
LQGLFRTGLLSSLTSAEVRIGMSTAREGAAWFYTHRVADDLKEHAVDRYWRVAQALGCDGPKLFRVPRFPAAAAWAQREFADWPRPWLAVSVGSRWLTKRWPPEHFHELLRRAQAAHGGSVLLVGTRDERAIAERTCVGLVGPWCNLAGRTTLPQLAALLRSADVVIANDSGPLHLAAALGRPIVAPYTCTQVSRHGPYGQEGRAVASTVACAGSYLRHCGRLDCMNELTADRLWPVLCEILQSWQECLPA